MTSVPVLRTSIVCRSPPRPDGRGYSLPALRAWISMFRWRKRTIILHHKIVLKKQEVAA